ncbi:MAG: hypothetical protein Q9160_009263 [Pyrenula sp. 1 TL-2023]
MEFTAHLRIMHGIELAESHLQTALETAHHTVESDPRQQECPLCLQSGFKTLRAFATHVAKHMEEIALSTLPPSTYSDSEDEPEDHPSRPSLTAQSLRSSATDDEPGPPKSCATELASFLSIRPLLEESESDPGVLATPSSSRPPADYTCPFHILDCTETFEAPNMNLFKDHVMGHFRGKTPPLLPPNAPSVMKYFRAQKIPPEPRILRSLQRSLAHGTRC